MQIRLATRGSRLALAQSGLIADQLRALGAHVELVTVRTFGDVSTAPLSTIGGTGVFVAAVREAVLSGDCDLAVHSLKDLPTTPADGLALAAVPEREDPRDALCAAGGLTLDTLPTGARVGTGSPRRRAQLLAVRPDLRVIDLRGNVDTRLGRVGTDLDAVVLAAAGLNRLGLSASITELLDPDVLVPAPAQGALALECRADNTAVRALVGRLDDPTTRAAVEAERETMRLVEAGCAAPFGALATVRTGRLTITARLVTAAGARTVQVEGAEPDTASLVESAADRVAPLRGLRVLMAASALAAELNAEGVEVTTAEFTRTEPLDVADFVAAMAEGPDALAFTSARTARVLAEAGLDLASLLRPGTVVAAVGERTAQAVRDAGLEVSVTGDGSGGAALAPLFPDPPGSVVIPGAADPAPGLAEGLSARGWRVQPVGVYRTRPVETLPADLRAAWPNGFDTFIATAPSTLAAADAMLGRPLPALIALGSTTAAAAAQRGLPVAAVATTATAAGLVQALLTMRKDV